MASISETILPNGYSAIWANLFHLTPRCLWTITVAALENLLVAK